MSRPVPPRASGAAFLAIGIAMLAVALSTGQYAFFGVGTPFLVLGLVFLGKGRAPR
jgi:hypothetical protein